MRGMDRGGRALARVMAWGACLPMAWATASAAVPPAAASASAPAPASPAASASPLQKVEVRHTRDAEDLARAATVATRVVTHEQMQQAGAVTAADALRREPSIVVTATGQISLLGLPGYTQVLLDGKTPSGRSPLELNVAEIERIEIIKSATADLPGRGIAGTINVITRRPPPKAEGRLNLSSQGGPGRRGASATAAMNTAPDEAGTQWGGRVTANAREERRHTWRYWLRQALDGQGGLHSESSEDEEGVREYRSALLTGQAWLRGRPAPGQMLEAKLQLTRVSTRSDEWLGAPGQAQAQARRAGLTRFDIRSLSPALEWTGNVPDGPRWSVEFEPSFSRTDERDHGWSGSPGLAPGRGDDERHQLAVLPLRMDLRRLALGDHQLSLGADSGWVRGRLHQATRAEGPGADATPSTLRQHDHSWRYAVFLQDQWQPDGPWSANLGLRLEGQRAGWSPAEGPDAALQAGQARRYRFAALLPSAHLAWTLTPRDTLRLSLARTLNAPPLTRVSAPASVNALYPCGPATCVANTPEAPDRVANPALRPEFSTGLNLSLDRRFHRGTSLSWSAVWRHIDDWMVDEVMLADVPWASVPRFVRRQANLGRASVRGTELEGRLSWRDLDEQAPNLVLRGGLSWMGSRARTPQGTLQRLQEQAPLSGKLSLDYGAPSQRWLVGLTASALPTYTARNDPQREIRRGRRLSLAGNWGWNFESGPRLRATLQRQWRPGPDDLLDYRASGLHWQAASREYAPLQASLSLELAL